MPDAAGLGVLAEDDRTPAEKMYNVPKRSSTNFPERLELSDSGPDLSETMLWQGPAGTVDEGAREWLIGQLALVRSACETSPAFRALQRVSRAALLLGGAPGGPTVSPATKWGRRDGLFPPYLGMLNRRI